MSSSTTLDGRRDRGLSNEAAGIKLYTISYDDAEGQRAFVENQGVRFPMLSDLGSHVIRDYGILNDRVGERDGGVIYGVPYPGAYVTDEHGVVVAKFFNDSYKKRDSPELYLDVALGKIELAEDAPQVVAEDPEVRITAAIHGGGGTIRQGITRKLVVRFELGKGLHLYGPPCRRG